MKLCLGIVGIAAISIGVVLRHDSSEGHATTAIEASPNDLMSVNGLQVAHAICDPMTGSMCDQTGAPIQDCWPVDCQNSTVCCQLDPNLGPSKNDQCKFSVETCDYNTDGWCVGGSVGHCGLYGAPPWVYCGCLTAGSGHWGHRNYCQ